MQDKLGTRKMKLGSHPDLFYNLVCNITFMESMYLLYVVNFISNHLCMPLCKKYENFSFFGNSGLMPEILKFPKFCDILRKIRNFGRPLPEILKFPVCFCHTPKFILSYTTFIWSMTLIHMHTFIISSLRLH